MKEIRLGKEIVGLNHKPYFVADIAANHDGEKGRLVEPGFEYSSETNKDFLNKNQILELVNLTKSEFN